MLKLVVMSKIILFHWVSHTKCLLLNLLHLKMEKLRTDSSLVQMGSIIFFRVEYSVCGQCVWPDLRARPTFAVQPCLSVY